MEMESPFMVDTEDRWAEYFEEQFYWLRANLIIWTTTMSHWNVS